MDEATGAEAPVETQSTETTDTAQAERVIENSAAMSNALRLLADKEAAIKARSSQFQTLEQEAERFKQLKAAAQSDPRTALEELGLSLDKLNDLKTESSDPSATLRREMETRYEQLQNTITQMEAREQQAAQAAVYNELRTSVGGHIEASNDYPLISAAGEEARELVFQQILNAHQTTGTALSEAEAAREVEARLVQLAEKLVPAFQAKNKLSANGAVTNTLTNNLAGQAATEVKKYDSGRDESDFEALIARANRLFRQD